MMTMAQTNVKRNLRNNGMASYLLKGQLRYNFDVLTRTEAVAGPMDPSFIYELDSKKNQLQDHEFLGYESP